MRYSNTEMRIAVNTRLLLKGRLEGIGWFTYETMKRITRWHPEHDFFFLFDRPYDSEFIFSENVKPVVLFPQSRHPVLWYIWFEMAVKKFIIRNKIDLFISPDGYLSLNSEVPQLAVIHDINFHHFPQDVPPFARLYLNHFFPKYATNACRIATVSKYSKEDISRSYKIDNEKIDVVYNGANERYQPLAEMEKIEIREKLTDGAPYFIFIGAFNPRKNIPRLLLAFEKFKEVTNSAIKLVLVGEKMYSTTQMLSVLKKMKFQNDVVFTGRLGVDQLKGVIGSAMAMTYFSYYEGFGIPLLEAMKCGVPLAVSNCTAIPEVVGEAAIFADPFDINSMVECMIKISSDDDLRNRLSANGLEQQKKFSWDLTATCLFNSIMKCIDHPC